MIDYKICFNGETIFKENLLWPPLELYWRDSSNEGLQYIVVWRKYGKLSLTYPCLPRAPDKNG